MALRFRWSVHFGPFSSQQALGASPVACPSFKCSSPLVPSSYEITGSLLEVNSDAPLVGLLVEAYAVDAPQDRRLGGTLTDANGAFKPHRQ